MARSLHALIYCRDGAGTPSAALRRQERRCRRTAARLGATETLTLVDRDAARTIDRPVLRHLRALLGMHCIDVVLTDRPSRLSVRSAEVRALRLEAARAGVRLLFAGPRPRRPRRLRRAPVAHSR